jgi:hypothetical protein
VSKDILRNLTLPVRVEVCFSNLPKINHVHIYVTLRLLLHENTIKTLETGLKIQKFQN